MCFSVGGEWTVLGGGNVGDGGRHGDMEVAGEVSGDR